MVSTPLYGVNGKLEGVIEVEHDVTQLVRMQAGLVASETRLQAIMDNVPDAILTCSEDGVIETFNQSARRLFGVSNSELVGMPLSQLVVDEVRFDAGKGDNRLREVTARRLNGAEFPADMWQGEMAPGGQTQHVVVVRDITLRRLAQEEGIHRLDERRLIQLFKWL